MRYCFNGKYNEILGKNMQRPILRSTQFHDFLLERAFTIMKTVIQHICILRPKAAECIQYTLSGELCIFTSKERHYFFLNVIFVFNLTFKLHILINCQIIRNLNITDLLHRGTNLTENCIPIFESTLSHFSWQPYCLL